MTAVNNINKHHLIQIVTFLAFTVLAGCEKSSGNFDIHVPWPEQLLFEYEHNSPYLLNISLRECASVKDSECKKILGQPENSDTPFDPKQGFVWEKLSYGDNRRIVMEIYLGDKENKNIVYKANSRLFSFKAGEKIVIEEMYWQDGNGPILNENALSFSLSVDDSIVSTFPDFIDGYQRIDVFKNEEDGEVPVYYFSKPAYVVQENPIQFTGLPEGSWRFVVCSRENDGQECPDYDGNISKEIKKDADNNSVISLKISDCKLRANKNLFECVKKHVLGGFWEEVRQEMLEKLETINCYTSQIDSLSGIEVLQNLKVAKLPFNPISDLSPLANLSHLEYINVRSSKINDISPLANLHNLERLNIGETGVQDITVLEDKVKLKAIDLEGAPLRDLSPLSNLKNLETLLLSNVTENGETISMESIQSLENLEYLFLNDCDIRNIDALKSLKKLKWLNLSGNIIKNTDVLMNFPELHILNIEDNCISSDTSQIKVKYTYDYNAYNNVDDRCIKADIKDDQNPVN